MKDSTNNRPRRFRAAPSLLGLLVLTGGFLLGLNLQAEVSAQEPPPAPRVTLIAGRNYTDTPRQYELVQALLEFAPGAATPWHRVAGRGLFTVVSGEITRVEESGEKRVFKVGETFGESPEDHYDYDANFGTAPARLLATFALIPGSEPLIIHPSLPFPGSSGPTFVAAARALVGTIPAQFTLVHGLIDFPAGASAALHTHDGWNMATGLTGAPVTNVVDGVTQAYAPGDVFVHGPGQAHELLKLPGPASIMFAAIGPTGAPPLRPLAPAPAAAPAVAAPATGDGGLLDGHGGAFPAAAAIGGAGALALAGGLGLRLLTRRA